MRGLDATIRAPADEVRLLDLVRLDKLWAAHYTRACRGNHRSTMICLRIMERRARLLGLDAPLHVAAKQGHRTGGGVLVLPGVFP
jgi:hypothetical protein